MHNFYSNKYLQIFLECQKDEKRCASFDRLITKKQNKGFDFRKKIVIKSIIKIKINYVKFWFLF